jgi:L-galactose dehydrogenase
LGDLLPYLTERGVGIFNSAPLAMRLLSAEGPPDWHPTPHEVRAKCVEAARYRRERDSDLAKLALQFSVANPNIHANVVGTASPQRISNNIRPCF